MPGYPAPPPGQAPYGAPGFAPPPGGPYPGGPAPAASGGGSMKWILIAVIAVVVLAAAGVLLYFFVFRGDGKSADPCDTVCSAYIKCETDKATKAGEKVDPKEADEEKAECVKYCRGLKPATQRESLKCTKVACDDMENCLESMEEFDKTAPAEPAKAGGGGGGESAAAAGGDSLAGCVEKLTACYTEAVQTAGMGADMLASMKSAAQQGCEGLVAGGRAIFDKAFAACKDKPCGANGGDFLQCLGQQMMAAAAAGS